MIHHEGIMMEIGRGTMSTIMCDETCVMDLIPVDIVVNTMITAALYNSRYGQVYFNFSILLGFY